MSCSHPELRSVVLVLVLAASGAAQHADPFRQLDELWPTPSRVRNAAGAPGVDYWQQQVDYVIDVEIDDQRQHLIGSERITYHNNSPDTLRYLWVQLDANIFAPHSHAALIGGAPDFATADFAGLIGQLDRREFDGGMTVSRVADSSGADIPHTINQTVMRVDLPQPLAPGEAFDFQIDWNYAINEAKRVGGRTAFERLEDGNCIYELAQWFPRLCTYDDLHGWQIKQYLGRGEFSLEFGNYEVRIKVPADHVVQATGELENADEILSTAMRERLERARTADAPVLIVTHEEAAAASESPAAASKTWIFRAENVRDFAFATSRSFIWDAMGVEIEGRVVMAMSLFPKEGEPLWHRYSTRAVALTLATYSHHAVAYPYPKAVSVNGPVGGMEYPMICFNGPRPEKDGTYSRGTKYGLISVVIHEVGHNWFPMIINTDERQWTWIDEGFNTFCQYLTEQAWEPNYPSRRGAPCMIVDYMKDPAQVPIMTASDSVVNFGNNAYGKTATALNILRETVLGRELFDFAFREYGRRWALKRPTPYDFFRTMEDASGVDLDWFWRGWFYSIDACDMAIIGVRRFELADTDLAAARAADRADEAAAKRSISDERNLQLRRLVQDHPELLDFYNEHSANEPSAKDIEERKALLERLDDRERALLGETRHFQIIDIARVGKLVMPVILQIHYEDDSKEEVRIPAQAWQLGEDKFSRLHVSKSRILRVVLDPYLETADIDLNNNVYPPEIKTERYFPGKPKPEENPMQQADKQ